MATVVRLDKDTRYAEAGKGIATFLERMQDGRLDRLQSQMMKDISEAGDEATASAIFGDPMYQSIVGDPNRMSAVTTHLNNAPLGHQSVPGYDKHGIQKIITIGENDDPQAELDKRGLTLERSRLRYAVDQNSKDDLGTSLGRFNDPREARASMGEAGEDSSITIMDQEEFATHLQTRASEISIGQRQQTIDLARDRYNFDINEPTTVFTNLIQDREEGRISPAQFEEAWRKLVFLGYGKTPDDVAENSKDDLQTEGALLAAMSDQAVNLMNIVRSDGTILSFMKGKAVRGFEIMSAELKAITDQTKLVWEDGVNVDTLDFGDFASQSTAFKNLMMDFAVTYAATQGQSNRSLSDKDFDRFLKIVGAGELNPKAFIVNMSALMAKSHRAFNIRHDRLQGFNYESTFGSFARFEFEDEAVRQQFKDELLNSYPDLEFKNQGDQ